MAEKAIEGGLNPFAVHVNLAYDVCEYILEANENMPSYQVMSKVRAARQKHLAALQGSIKSKKATK